MSAPYFHRALLPEDKRKRTVQPVKGLLKGRRFDQELSSRLRQPGLETLKHDAPIVPGGAAVPGGIAPDAVIPPLAANGVTADFNLVSSILADTFKDKFDATNVVRLGDNDFYLPKRSEVEMVVKQSNADSHNYRPDYFDCEDFSYVLKADFSECIYQANANAAAAGQAPEKYAFAAGLIWANFDWMRDSNGNLVMHSINLVILDDQSVLLIEPQRDRYYEANTCVGGISIIVM